LFQDDGGPPANLGIISRGTKVYLSCTQFEELVDGHCWIIPMQHCLSSLKLDDDVWDEIKVRFWHNDDSHNSFNFLRVTCRPLKNNNN
jgi:hypothetical protein